MFIVVLKLLAVSLPQLMLPVMIVLLASFKSNLQILGSALIDFLRL